MPPPSTIRSIVPILRRTPFIYSLIKLVSPPPTPSQTCIGAGPVTLVALNRSEPAAAVSMRLQE